VSPTGAYAAPVPDPAVQLTANEARLLRWTSWVPVAAWPLTIVLRVLGVEWWISVLVPLGAVAAFTAGWIAYLHFSRDIPWRRLLSPRREGLGGYVGEAQAWRHHHRRGRQDASSFGPPR
jgi:hypothetical protein